MSQRVQPLVLLSVLLLLLIFVLLNQVILREVRHALDLHHALLVELKEFLLPVENLFKEFLAAGASAHLLPRSHLLLETIQSSRLFLAVRENALSFVELAIDELTLEQVISVALTHQFCIRHLIGVDIHLDLLTEGLLDRVKLD